jgi:hypothetical protein
MGAHSFRRLYKDAERMQRDKTRIYRVPQNRYALDAEQ